MKKLKELFREKSWWEKSTEEINKEIKMINRLVYGLSIFGFLICIYCIINGLFLHF